MNDLYKTDRKKSMQKQKRADRFAHEYVHNGYDATNAALSAGYSSTERSAASAGSLQLKDPYVQNLIKRYEDEKKQCATYTFEWVVQKLAETVIASQTGKTTEKALYDAKGVTDACDKISKMYGYYAPEKQLHAHGTVDSASGQKIVIELVGKYESTYDR